MSNFMDFIVEVILPFSLLAIILIAPVVTIAEFSAYNACQNYQQNTGKQTKYEWFDSCYVNTETGWQRWDEYKARATTNED